MNGTLTQCLEINVTNYFFRAKMPVSRSRSQIVAPKQKFLKVPEAGDAVNMGKKNRKKI